MDYNFSHHIIVESQKNNSLGKIPATPDLIHLFMSSFLAQSNRSVRDLSQIRKRVRLVYNSNCADLRRFESRHFTKKYFGSAISKCGSETLFLQ